MGADEAEGPSEVEHTASTPTLLCAHCGTVMPPGLGGGRGKKRFCCDRHRVAYHRTADREAVVDAQEVLGQLLDSIDQLRARVVGTIARISKI